MTYFKGETNNYCLRGREQNKTKQNKTKRNKTKQNKTKQTCAQRATRQTRNVPSHAKAVARSVHMPQQNKTDLCTTCNEADEKCPIPRESGSAIGAYAPTSRRQPVLTTKICPGPIGEKAAQLEMRPHLFFTILRVKQKQQ